MRLILLAALLAAVVAVAPSRVSACASCACGDPTLTLMGTEKAFAGRLRSRVLWQYRGESEAVGDFSSLDTAEQRIELATSYAFSPELTFALRVPLSYRHVRQPNLARESAFGLGNAQLLTRYVFWQDRPAFTRHMLAIQPAVTLPTAPTLRRDGEALMPELQPGRGGPRASLALIYNAFLRPWSFFGSTSIVAPLADRFGERLGTTWLTSVTGQYQPHPVIALQAGFDGRWATRGRIDGAVDTHSGGAILFASGGLLIQPMTDALMHITVRWPTVDALPDGSREGPMFEGGVSYDF